MTSTAKTVKEYIETIDIKWKDMIIKLRDVIKNNIPKGFKETMNYGMIGYVVPHDIYPNGYHVNPKDPLPFIGIAAQKNNIAFYHLGIYGNKKLHDWFINSYEVRYGKKFDMGKSCFRFKKEENIPYDLIKELVGKIDVENYIKAYEKTLKRKK